MTFSPVRSLFWRIVEMAKYGFLGMGIMGSAMAANLVRLVDDAGDFVLSHDADLLRRLEDA